ncbi:hypothetical protein G9C85_14080 [Halorubellus sp. JP-L1]|uniref:DUF7344 domain-containing protein n=1 Tax=Halorubellus sp. JP-L1 TaxID=2715753 RepID=UPI00140B1104|nr:hypothetical protein [Halorubellus sp. JP-L1]NHN42750.1 hypothetical protein [Halorubellus sp. JP-L1]
MSTKQDQPGDETRNRTIDALSDGVRRRIVRVLAEATAPVSLEDLAKRLVASTPEATGTNDVESLRVRLHHVHLPMLAASGLVDVDDATREVTATDHAVYDRENPSEIPLGDAGSSSRRRKERRRRGVVAILASESEPMDRETLARELAHRESDGRPAASLVDDIDVALHHQHLPKLDRSGVLEYDSDAETVQY